MPIQSIDPSNLTPEAKQILVQFASTLGNATSPCEFDADMTYWLDTPFLLFFINRIAFQFKKRVTVISLDANTKRFIFQKKEAFFDANHAKIYKIAEVYELNNGQVSALNSDDDQYILESFSETILSHKDKENKISIRIDNKTPKHKIFINNQFELESYVQTLKETNETTINQPINLPQPANQKIEKTNNHAEKKSWPQLKEEHIVATLAKITANNRDESIRNICNTLKKCAVLCSNDQNNFDLLKKSFNSAAISDCKNTDEFYFLINLLRKSTVIFQLPNINKIKSIDELFSTFQDPTIEKFYKTKHYCKILIHLHKEIAMPTNTIAGISGFFSTSNPTVNTRFNHYYQLLSATQNTDHYDILIGTILTDRKLPSSFKDKIKQDLNLLPRHVEANLKHLTRNQTTAAKMKVFHDFITEQQSKATNKINIEQQSKTTNKINMVDYNTILFNCLVADKPTILKTSATK